MTGPTPVQAKTLADADGLEFLPHELAVWARVVAVNTGVRPIDVVIECVRSGYMWHRRNVSRGTSARSAA